jgi:hypothetical protein
MMSADVDAALEGSAEGAIGISRRRRVRGGEAEGMGETRKARRRAEPKPIEPT